MSSGPVGVGDKRSNTWYSNKLLSCRTTSLELTSTATALYVGAVSRIVRTGVRARCSVGCDCGEAIKTGDGSSRNTERRLSSSGEATLASGLPDSSNAHASIFSGSC